MDMRDPRREYAAIGMMVIILLAALFLADVVTALPPAAPAIPNDGLPQTNIVSIVFPSSGAVVNSSTAIQYQHTAFSALDCSLYIDADAPVNAAVIGGVIRSENVVLPNGTHAVIVNCSNASIAVSSGIIPFTVVNSTSMMAGAVSIIYPLGNATPALNLTYRHSASGIVNCTAWFDNAAPRIKRSVVADVDTVETYTGLPTGMHVFDVNCTNGTWRGSARRSVQISNTTGVATTPVNITILPRLIFQGTTVQFNATFSPYSTVEVTVEDPGGRWNITSYTVGPSGMLRGQYVVPYNAPTGMHLIIAASTDEDVMVKEGWFNVTRRVPAIYLANNRTTVPFGTPVVVEGEQFLQSDNISLTLIGGGTNLSYAATDAEGDFTFTYYNLAVRAYDLTVKSVARPTVMDTLSFNVTPANVTGTNRTNATNTTQVAVIGAGNSSNTTGDVFADLGHADVELESENGGEYYADYEPTPVSTVGDGDVDQDILADDAGSPSSGGGLRWLIALVVLVVIVGGTAGYLVYNGTLDLSSADAFKESVGALFSGGHAPRQSAQSMPISMSGGTTNAFGEPVRVSRGVRSAESETIRSFVYAERAKGFDDLTIRSGLIGHGWDKAQVDATFDEIYREQNGP